MKLVQAKDVQPGATLRSGSRVIRVERPDERTVIIFERLSDGSVSEGYCDPDDEYEVRK